MASSDSEGALEPAGPVWRLLRTMPPGGPSLPCRPNGPMPISVLPSRVSREGGPGQPLAA